MKFKAEIEKANILIEALPYIKKFSGQTIVIKIGGSLMINTHLKEQIAKDIVLLKYIGLNPVIVHGGGQEISNWMSKVGKKSVFIDGLRVTDHETMEITEMVLSGKIGNEIVSLINKHGGKAVSLSGKDGHLFKSLKRKSKSNQDLGFVGDITQVDNSLLNTLHLDNYIAVIASVGISEDGDTLNMNADHVAEQIAIGTNALKLFYLTDVQGISKNSKLVQKLTLKSAKLLQKHKDIRGGMIPKLHCAIQAIQKGVSHVHIINGNLDHALLLELFTDTGTGTMITKE
ncbi:MAG: acetylglutamate kinase [Candidatus Margulisbacteria bacterium]|nr:acetylglutamate kinase [Candidatus Margulisiibacteriota bacterium]